MSGAGPGLLLPEWPAPAGVRAAFTLRTGGVSAAPYDSLNMGASIGDSPEAVAENRRRVAEALRLPAEPGWLEQVHGIHVVTLNGCGVGAPAGDGVCPAGIAGSRAAGMLGGSGGAPTQPGTAPPRSGGESVGQGETPARLGGTAVGPGGASVFVAAGAVPKGDASVATGPGWVCAIRVADCMPVLFAALDGSAVGAAHAGWRGLAGGVLEATVERLGVPASHLIAWMGPAIGQENFEVGEDVRTAFMATDPDAASAFVPNARGRWQCDLYTIAPRRLAAIGVAGVYGGGWCTFADSERFFSFRRNSQTGRMAALIWIES